MVPSRVCTLGRLVRVMLSATKRLLSALSVPETVTRSPSVRVFQNASAVSTSPAALLYSVLAVTVTNHVGALFKANCRALRSRSRTVAFTTWGRSLSKRSTNCTMRRSCSSSPSTKIPSPTCTSRQNWVAVASPVAVRYVASSGTTTVSSGTSKSCKVLVPVSNDCTMPSVANSGGGGGAGSLRVLMSVTSSSWLPKASVVSVPEIITQSPSRSAVQNASASTGSPKRAYWRGSAKSKASSGKSSRLKV